MGRVTIESETQRGDSDTSEICVDVEEDAVGGSGFEVDHRVIDTVLGRTVRIRMQGLEGYVNTAKVSWVMIELTTCANTGGESGDVQGGSAATRHVGDAAVKLW